jgi:hypothetical protein
MKNLKNIFAITLIAILTIQPFGLNAANNEKNNISLSEECVSNEVILRYVVKLGYSNPQIVEEIGCDRIVQTDEALLYVRVAGGKIVGAEIIGN